MLNFVKLTNFAISLRTIYQTSFLIMDLYSTTMASHHPCFVFIFPLKGRRLGFKVWSHQCNIILNFLGGWLTWNVDLGRPTCSFASWKALESHFGFLDKLEHGRECPFANFKLIWIWFIHLIVDFNLVQHIFFPPQLLWEAPVCW